MRFKIMFDITATPILDRDNYTNDNFKELSISALHLTTLLNRGHVKLLIIFGIDNIIHKITKKTTFRFITTM